MEAILLYTTLAVGPIPPDVEKTRGSGEGSTFYFYDALVVRSLLLLLILFVALTEGSIPVTLREGANARPQSFTLREEARSCLGALSQLSWSTLLPVIVERHLVSGYNALKLYSFHVTHPRRKALPYVRKRDAAHMLREESPYIVFNGQLDYNLKTWALPVFYSARRRYTATASIYSLWACDKMHTFIHIIYPQPHSRNSF